MGFYASVTSWLPATTTTQSHCLIGLDSSTLQSTTVIKLIARKESFVNSFLSNKYTVPLTNCTYVIGIVEDLVTYEIWKLLVGRDGVIDQQIIDQYNLALNVLTSISKGNQKIVTDSGTIVSERDISTRCWVNNKGYTQTFNVDDSINWKVSEGRLSDIADARDSDVSS
jgi:phage gp36-like protein